MQKRSPRSSVLSAAVAFSAVISPTFIVTGSLLGLTNASTSKSAISKTGTLIAIIMNSIEFSDCKNILFKMPLSSLPSAITSKILAASTTATRAINLKLIFILFNTISRYLCPDHPAF